MPPPSPVWAWNYQQKPAAKAWRGATLHMALKIDGAWHESKPATLKVKDPNPKVEPKK